MLQPLPNENEDYSSEREGALLCRPKRIFFTSQKTVIVILSELVKSIFFRSLSYILIYLPACA
jgi:hypothetical protein